MDSKSVCDRIISERNKLGLTQEEMAQRVGISANSYRELEKGKTAIFNKRIIDISEIFGITPEELLLGYPSPSEEVRHKLEEAEKEFNRKISDIESRYKLSLAEIEGELNILKATIQNKEKIIGILKEKSGDY